jgi:hypothetical protein
MDNQQSKSQRLPRGRDAYEQIKRLTSALHQHRCHPDYEYATTTCGRKAGPAPIPEGAGWEPNTYTYEHPVDGPTEWHSEWERFDFHEDHYWRRLRG